MNGFISVAKNVYYLAPPTSDFGGGVTLITGLLNNTQNVLIDCGAFDYSVTRYILPALKELKLDIKSISYLLFTHCSTDNMGGVHKIKQLNPDIKILYCGTNQANKLKNPSHFFMEKWSDYLDHSPPFREVRGILPTGSVDINSRIFSEISPFNAVGHDDDCVYWVHVPTNTVICGDAVQGNGTHSTGIAFITEFDFYQNTLLSLISRRPNNLVCSKDFRLCPSIVNGTENCLSVLEASLDVSNEYSAFVDKYAKAYRRRKENLDIEALARAYFENKEQPNFYGYAIKTFKSIIFKDN